MFTDLAKSLCVVVVCGVAAFACDHEGDSVPGVTATTSAVLPKEAAARSIAKSRCRRAAECNRIGAGQRYGDKDDCLDMEASAANDAAATCTRGVDRARLDKCIDSLENQHCDADLGRVTAIEYCSSYCAK